MVKTEKGKTKMKNGINVLSLFDGMSSAQIALERAGVSVNKYYACEIDPYAIKVTQANYPSTIQLGSITDLQWNDTTLHSHLRPKIDLLVGGSPCQGFSFAGKRANFNDPRSKLFFEYVRLLKEVKPKYFLLENVKMNKKSENVISDLLGVKPVEINSNLVSAQNRKRLYWTNIPFDMPTDKGIILQDIIEDGFTDREKSHCIDANYFKGGNLKSYFEKHRRQLVFSDNGLCHVGTTKTTWRKLTPLECERLQTVPEGYTDHVSNTQRYKMLGNGFTIDVIANFFKGV